MEHTGKTAEILNALKSDMTAQIYWLKSCQISSPGSPADGAISRYPGQGSVTPYFSNFAAMALLEEPACLPSVERYLNWYLRNQEKNGTIRDYYYDSKYNYKTTAPDSEDAYAGTFLTLAFTYYKKASSTSWINNNIKKLKKIATSVVNLIDRDGLTFVLAGRRTKFLMDNCEAYRGLADFAELLGDIGDQEAPFYKAKAEVIAGGIDKVLFNPQKQYYHPSKRFWIRPRVNLKRFYPDTACQVFPVLYGLIKPESGRGGHLYRVLNDYHGNWVTIKPPDHPWMILGFYSCLHKNYAKAYEKIRHSRKAYIDTGSGSWFCAESAFFTLTCAKLILERDKWLY